MEIQGTLKQLNPVIERGEFKSRKVWLDTDTETKYPQVIELELSGKGIDIFDGISIGAPVTCSINLRGRSWTDPQGVVKVFNTLQCWKVQAAGSSPKAEPAVKLPETGDLPF